MNSLLIYILSHKPIADVFPKKPEYRYVQCNSVTGRLAGFDVYDDTHSSISDLNWCFSEATAINRVIADETLVSASEFIGFGQYRRYLDYSSDDIRAGTIACSSMDMAGTIYQQYAACHPTWPYEIFMKKLECVDDSLFKRIDFYFNSSSTLYRANCFIADAAIFRDYACFVKRIIPLLSDIVRDMNVDVNRMSAYQRRYMSFLFERLTSFWIFNKSMTGTAIRDVQLVDLDIPNTENGTR